MSNEKCDLVHPNGVKEKKMEVIGGYTIKYHANGKTMWSKGKMIDGNPDGYWEWYRPDGTIKRSGYFNMGEPVGEWITYDSKGQKYNSTHRGDNKKASKGD
jgi:antitoxin component YwqK of YwqJK toxin-antitoxin module